MRPVQRIAEEARGITGTAGGHRITTHADVAEFTGLIQVLNDMLARLERVRAWHQRIIRDLGHDLRTPITAMRTGTEVALWSERTPEEYRRVLHSTLEETERLAVISDALMLLGRLESGDLQPQLTRMDVRSEVRDVIERARQRSADHRFEVVCSSTIVEVEADPVLLGMVLDQLLDNAVRYTPAGTRIRVSAMLADGAAQVVVEDNGPGVPAAKLPHLFEPFYRADEARGRNGGPGLGLTVARSIVELHDGTVAAERGAESGLLIRIRLPVSSGHGAGVLA
jgi:two-component system heavy metal sensor histidine kinase CusS